tara:strand:+ start:165 stop:347 length:183 start_codon:yes stop_codon:yes gene_type:complete
MVASITPSEHGGKSLVDVTAVRNIETQNTSVEVFACGQIVCTDHHVTNADVSICFEASPD